jgi:hypothetical protein
MADCNDLYRHSVLKLNYFSCLMVYNRDADDVVVLVIAHAKRRRNTGDIEIRSYE